MTDLYAEDYLEKHPLEPAPWDLPDPECPLCRDPRCESERVCGACRTEGRQLARQQPDTLPAPDGSAEAPVAEMSTATIYQLVRHPGALSMLVMGGVL